MRQGQRIFIGYYTTRKQAEDVEREFDKGWPPGTDAWGNNLHIIAGRKGGMVRREKVGVA